MSEIEYTDYFGEFLVLAAVLPGGAFHSGAVNKLCSPKIVDSSAVYNSNNVTGINALIPR